MKLAIWLINWVQVREEDLDPEVIEQLPPDIVEQIRNGTLDKLPEDVVDRLPPALVDRVPSDLIDAASANPLFAVLGVIAIAGFLFGVVKSAIKWAVLFGVAAAISWFLFFQSG